MSELSEDQLASTLLDLVSLWRACQRGDGKLCPLVGGLAADDPNETYIIRPLTRWSARVPTRPVTCPLSAIEDLIHMGYLIPKGGSETLTWLQPTVDALLLADESGSAPFRLLFHIRFERLHSRAG